MPDDADELHIVLERDAVRQTGADGAVTCDTDLDLCHVVFLAFK